MRSDLLFHDAVPPNLLKGDGFLTETLIYIPSATICRQGKESSASSVVHRRKIAQSRRKKWD
jgi:hypothetical protein